MVAALKLTATGRVPAEAITSTKPPQAVADQDNGAVKQSLLMEVDGRSQPEWKLAAAPARGMRAMHAALERELGITLTSTNRGRTLAQQWEIFGGVRARYKPCTAQQFEVDKADDKERVKTWPSEPRGKVAELLGVTIADSVHWTKIEIAPGKFPATAAVPGTSPHGMWCADDLALLDGPDPDTFPDSVTITVAEWLFNNSRRFGFAHGIASEIWHVQWIAGDTIPPEVLQFEDATGGPPARGRGGRGTGRGLGRNPIPKKEDDVAKALRIEDEQAIFLANGITLSWVNDLKDYDVAVFLGLAPPLGQANVVDRSVLRAFRLVGAIPPGFSPDDFQEVIGSN